MSNPTSGMILPPWYQVVFPNKDVQEGKMEQADYAANLHAVINGAAKSNSVYGSAERFFAATYMTTQLIAILNDVMKVLAGQAGDRVLQLRTPFGGGKTHTLIALYYWATSPDQLSDVAEETHITQVSGVRVGYFSGAEHTASAGQPLWRVLLSSAIGVEQYDKLAAATGLGDAPPAGQFIRACLGDQPTLLLLDEVANYITAARAVPMGGTDLSELSLVFLQNLSETISKMERVAMVYSLPTSKETGLQSQTDALVRLEHMAARVEARREPVSGDEVLRVVQTRLFRIPPANTPERDKFEKNKKLVAKAYREAQAKLSAYFLKNSSEAQEEAEQLEQRIDDSYPFHPELLDMMYKRWGTLPNYQRTRGALQFLASVVHALWDGKKGQALIGPGDVPLSDEDARSSFLTQVTQANERSNFGSVIGADIAGVKPNAREVDKSVGTDSPQLDSLKLGTRLATAIMLYSFGVPSGEQEGVSPRTLFSAVLTPDLDRNVMRYALDDLSKTLLYLHVANPNSSNDRYRFRTQPNINLLINRAVESLKADEGENLIRAELEKELAKAGSNPLIGKLPPWPDGPGNVPDRQRQFRVVYLGPKWAEYGEQELQNKLLEMVEKAGTTTARNYRNALALAVPVRSKVQAAREAARQITAIQNLLNAAATVGTNAEQQNQGVALASRRNSLNDVLADAVRNLYDDVYMPRTGPEGGISFTRSSINVLSQQGKSIHDRVTAALTSSQAEQAVYSEMLPHKLVVYLGLATAEGGPGRVAFISGQDAVDAMFSFLDKPKLTSADAIRSGVVEGITSPRLGYAKSASVEGGTLHPNLNDFYYGADYPLTAKEIALTADEYIVGEGLAQQLIAQRRQLEEERQQAEAARQQQLAEQRRAAELAQAATQPQTAVATDQPTPTVVSQPSTSVASTPSHQRLTITTDSNKLFDVVVNLSDKDSGISKYIRSVQVVLDLEIEGDDASNRLSETISKLEHDGIEVQRGLGAVSSVLGQAAGGGAALLPDQQRGMTGREPQLCQGPVHGGQC